MGKNNYFFCSLIGVLYHKIAQSRSLECMEFIILAFVNLYTND
jgi:hypothetical protein